ncbi:P-loop NTPase fold protein [uncultured Methanolobus sp.]|uniref:P-loop NTPase fold protein n=1 Tax=uncultured Methanolobus sp. TaxID=218300 RepID=UPI002AAC32BB|nr:P-loop NTPase fold protein [uncultured Methanolobus sp.]
MDYDFPEFNIVLAGIVAFLGTIAAFKEYINKIFQNPFEMDLKKCLESPDYTNYVTFVEKFHDDFSKVVDAYSNNSKVYIFIDDLDRCEIPTAADLMQAINLLIANDPNLVFIIGMDRMKVASGIAAKNKDLLPYLYSSNPSNKYTFNGDLHLFGLNYGYEFMEKFIQVPFSVPKPDKVNVQNYIKELLRQEPQKQNDSLVTLVKRGCQFCWG